MPILQVVQSPYQLIIRKCAAPTIGDVLEMDALNPQQLAEVVDENRPMQRVHAVENGEDLSDYTMIAFGARATSAGRLAEKAGIARTLIPTGAGVGSAIGFCAPFS